MSYSSTGVVQVKGQDLLPKVTCLRDKTVEHTITPMELSVENLQHLWEIGRKYKTIFGHMHDDDFYKFISYFVTLNDNEPPRANGLFWKIDDFAGLVYVTDISVENLDCSVHYAFYKSMGPCKKPVLDAALNYLFTKYKMNRVSTEAGLHVNKRTHLQIEELGFKLEGLRRHAKFFDNKFFHVKYYGLLKSDFYSQRDLK